MDGSNETLAVATQGLAGDWVYLEVMGHRSHYGLLSEFERFGAKMARIDVFRTGENDPCATHFYGGSAIFSITPMKEESCRKQADYYSPRPAVQSLPAPSDDEAPDFSDDDDDEVPF